MYPKMYPKINQNGLILDTFLDTFKSLDTFSDIFYGQIFLCPYID